MVGIGSVFQCVGSILVRLHDFASLHNQYGCAVRDLEGGLFCCGTTGDVDGVGTGFSNSCSAGNRQFIHTNFQWNSFSGFIILFVGRNCIIIYHFLVIIDITFYIY